MSDVNKLKFIAKFYQQFSDSNADPELVRRVDLLVTLSVVGGFSMTLFAGIAYFQNNVLLAVLDLMGVSALVINLFSVLRYRKYEIGIHAGLIIVSFLFASLYLYGGVENTTFVWLFVYPGVSTFLIGSKRGRIAIILMTLPIIFVNIFGGILPTITDYSPSFELRFVAAYGVVGYFSFLFERIAEENRSEILATNVSLEQTVEERTSELSRKNHLLAKEVRDRTEAEQVTAVALKEKEILLQEVHHRTKNNLAVIMSIMSLQQSPSTSDEVRGVLTTLRHRISSMFLVHDHLYQSETLASINLGSYIKKLVTGLQESFSRAADDIVLDIRCHNLELSLEQSIPVGLVLNEIITNSFKHAVNPSEQLVQSIELQVNNQQTVIIDITDNGTGLAEDFNLKDSKSLGGRMIYMLIEDQLDGEIRVESSNGLHYHLEFPQTPIHEHNSL